MEKTMKPTFAIDETVTVDINGSRQRIRLCATRSALPPVLIVQHGPGFPLLHEAGKFQRLLHLENDHLVAYWEQRGCGNATADEARRVTLEQQVEDLLAVVRWLAERTRGRVLLFGVSIGATIALLAAARDEGRLTAVIANSPDLQTRAADAAVDAFLRDRAHRAGTPRLQRALAKLGPPPYLDPRAFQRRAALLMDSGTIERGATFNSSLRNTLVAMIRSYGVIGAVRSLRNMNIIQRRMLDDVASLDLLTHPPKIAVPVHFVFGELDALTAAFASSELPGKIGGPGTTAVRVSDAGHLVHFDRPDVLRSIAEPL
jgi:proline iminopeptidase